jgi:hypothetical protein
MLATLRLDGGRAEVALLGDLGVGGTAGHGDDDVAFAVGEAAHAVGDGGVDGRAFGEAADEAAG